jgi:uncharacterized protein (TIGR02678 family)
VTARLAVHLSPHELPELQRAARTLLRTPLVTAQQGDDYRLVAKWESVLRTEFTQKVGYRLDVSRTAARLLRRPASLTSHRGATLESGRTLSRWGYVYLCCTLAALEHPGHQVIASELLTRITNLARGDDRLAIDTTEYAQRRAFRDAVRYLERVGVLVVRDGNVDALIDDGQVLWDLDRDAAAMCMVAAPSILRSVGSVEDFIAEHPPSSAEARSRLARQRLNRRLVDQPVVLFADLSDDEAELAWRNRRREAENVTRLTGCEVELRREGMILIDHPTRPLGAARFPGTDAVAHAALLWLDALLAEAETPAVTDDSGPLTDAGGGSPDGHVASDTTRFVPHDIAEACWTRMLEEYANRLNQFARERPDRFRGDVVDLLGRFRLATFTRRGIEVTASANRYRARPSPRDESPGAPEPQQAMF